MLADNRTQAPMRFSLSGLRGLSVLLSPSSFLLRSNLSFLGYLSLLLCLILGFLGALQLLIQIGKLCGSLF